MSNIIVTIIKVLLWAIAIYILYRIGLKMYDLYATRFDKNKIDQINQDKERKHEIKKMREQRRTDLSGKILDNTHVTLNKTIEEVGKTQRKAIKTFPSAVKETTEIISSYSN